MPLLSKSSLAAVAVCTGLVVASGTGGAVAGAVITGKQIKNNTVTTKDIKDGTLSTVDMSPEVLAALHRIGIAGPAGAKGDKGDPGEPGVAERQHAQTMRRFQRRDVLLDPSPRSIGRSRIVQKRRSARDVDGENRAWLRFGHGRKCQTEK